MAVTTYQAKVAGVGSLGIIHENPDNGDGDVAFCELSSTSMVAVYNDETDNVAYAKIGTRAAATPNLVAWGTEYAITATDMSSIIVVKLSGTSFVIVYKNVSTGAVQAVAATVSGTAITFGSAAGISAGAGTPLGASLVDTNKVIIVFDDNATAGKAQIITISGTTISGGSAFTFKAANIFINSTTGKGQVAALSTTTAVVCYKIATTQSAVQILNISGTTITGNTEVAFTVTNDAYQLSVAALGTAKFACAYVNSTTYSVVGDHSAGTITLGTPVQTFNGGLRGISVVNTGAGNYMVLGNQSATINAYVQAYSGNVVTNLTTISGGSTGLSVKSQSYAITTQATSSGLVSLVALGLYNQTVIGYIGYAGGTVGLVEAMFELAVAATGETLQISSIYAKAGVNLTYVVLGLDGTKGDYIIYRNGIADQFTPVSSFPTQNYVFTKVMNLANNPIILTEGQALYGTIGANSPGYNRGVMTVFGIKET